ncbi:hypothetical protein F5Y07DRAFT_397679 [Xylaria sp. FL0933]|nr:hypothetical protein F5Y07DRAFT_397679 [Xylaria sp. FL0933]
MLDEIHPDLQAESNDTNAYTLGSIGSHNIVIACLPSGKIGTNSAATVATQMIRSFPAIRFGLMVGIGGGIPSKVQLGDVVVSVPGGEHPGVIQWDLGKAQHGNNFKRTGALNNPPSILLTALGKLATRHEMRGSEAETFVDDMEKRWPKLSSKYQKPSPETDVVCMTCYDQASSNGTVDQLRVIHPPTREPQINCTPVQNDDRSEVRTKSGKRKYREVSPATDSERTQRKVLKTTQKVDVQGTVQVAGPSRLDQVESATPLKEPRRSDESAQGLEAKRLSDQDNSMHCISNDLEKRQPREMLVHHGLIASGNRVIKDAGFRDQVNTSLGGEVLCFEMEAAGLMNNFPCIVIRGICDYADSHKEKTWQEYAAAIAAAFTKELLSCVQPAEVKRQQPVQDLIGQLSNSLENLQRRMVQLASHQQEEECVKRLDWLTPQNYGSQHSDNLKALHPETGEWLLRSQVFQEWLDAEAHQHRKHSSMLSSGTDPISSLPNPNNSEEQLQTQMISQQRLKPNKRVLYCSGIPGAGKTVMTSKVIRYLESRFSSNERVGIAYLYCNYARRTEQTIEHFIASLARQLIQKHLSVLKTPRKVSKSLDELYCRHKIEKTQPSRAELSTILRSAIAEYSEVFVIIDALDECNTSNECRIDLLTELFQLQHSSMVRIFATSRINSGIASLFRSASHIQILAHAEDLGSYLESRMKRYDQDLFDDILRQSVIAEIVKAAKGMFLLAKLHIDALLGLPTIGEVKMGLKSLSQGPRGLVAMYEQAMERIESQGPSTRELAKKVLKWIVHARSPLSVAALQHALAIRPELSFFDKDFIPRSEVLQSCCAGLVAIDKESDVVRLIHYTTKEYFETSSSRWFPEAQLDLSKDCITYLSYSDFDTGCCVHEEDYTDRCRFYPFHAYAACNWGHHGREARICEDAIPFLKKQPQLEASIEALARNTPNLFSWSSKLYKTAFGMTALHLAAYNGLDEVVRAMLPGHSSNARDADDRTPISYAAMFGHAAVAEKLLAHGADPDVHDSYGMTPLLYATERCHNDTVEVLQARGTMTQVHKHDYLIRPLSSAARNGHVDIVKQLLAHGAEPNTQKWRIGETPLINAVRNGNEAIVKLLLNHGAETHAKEALFNGQTALSSAAEKGFETIAELLLAHGADPNAGDPNPILKAIIGGHADIVELLLARGADPNAGYPSAVLLHTIRGDEDVGEPWPAYRADPNDDLFAICHYLSDTPLSLAARLGHESIVRLLLSDGRVQPDAKDIFGDKPLLLASRYGKVEVVNLLLDDPRINPTSEERSILERDTAQRLSWTETENTNIAGFAYLVRFSFQRTTCET